MPLCPRVAPPLLFALTLLAGPAACDDAAEVKRGVESGAEKTAEAAKQTAEAAKQTAAAAKQTAAQAQESLEETRRVWAERSAAARAWAEDLSDTGELSNTARAWLSAGAEATQDGAESLLVRGEQVAPVAVSIGRSLAEVYDSDTVLEPVYQPIGAPGDDPETGNAKADAAIKDMGRVEVVDGVSVGFKDLTSTSTRERVSERGYLVLWRKDDHLVGFVYRSRKTIDLEKLVAEAPKLLGLVDRGIASASE